MTRKTEYLTGDATYLSIQTQVLAALETRPEMWADGMNEYAMDKLVMTVKRATNILYALRMRECDLHGLGGAGALELATKIEPYIETEFLARLTTFNDRNSEDCIHCGKHVVSLHKVGRCVYADPCGCRLWQGTIPIAWLSAKLRPAATAP